MAFEHPDLVGQLPDDIRDLIDLRRPHRPAQGRRDRP
jgi:hypothetical protein